jgi:hypothetical protein
MASRKKSDRGFVSIPADSAYPTKGGKSFKVSEVHVDDERFNRATGTKDLSKHPYEAIAIAWARGEMQKAIGIARNHYRSGGGLLGLEKLEGFEEDIRKRARRILKNDEMGTGGAVELINTLGKGWDWSGEVQEAFDLYKEKAMEKGKKRAMEEKMDSLRAFLGKFLKT